jgi:hypothetical protein
MTDTLAGTARGRSIRIWRRRHVMGQLELVYMQPFVYDENIRASKKLGVFVHWKDKNLWELLPTHRALRSPPSRLTRFAYQLRTNPYNGSEQCMIEHPRGEREEKKLAPTTSTTSSRSHTTTVGNHDFHTRHIRHSTGRSKESWEKGGRKIKGMEKGGMREDWIGCTEPGWGRRAGRHCLLKCTFSASDF